MHDLCIFLICFCSKIIFAQKFFLYVEINLTTRGPLYTCLVVFHIYCNKIHINILQAHLVILRFFCILDLELFLKVQAAGFSYFILIYTDFKMNGFLQDTRSKLIFTTRDNYVYFILYQKIVLL